MLDPKASENTAETLRHGKVNLPEHMKERERIAEAVARNVLSDGFFGGPEEAIWLLRRAANLLEGRNRGIFGCPKGPRKSSEHPLA